MVHNEITPVAIRRLCDRAKGGQDLEIAGLPAPQTVGRASHNNDVSVFMVGPGEWLVLQKTQQDTPELDHDDSLTVFEESGAWRLLRLNRDSADGVVSQFSPIDLHAARSAGLECVSTHLAGHPTVLILNQSGSIDVLVRRSYASSLIGLFNGAAANPLYI